MERIRFFLMRSIAYYRLVEATVMALQRRRFPKPRTGLMVQWLTKGSNQTGFLNINTNDKGQLHFYCPLQYDIFMMLVKKTSHL